MAIVKLATPPAPTSDAAIRHGVRTIDDVEREISVRGMQRYPLDVEAVASALGLRVIYEQMDDDMSGFLEHRPLGWTAGINAFHHPVRQRFTLAHEIAHFVLHRDCKQEFRDQTFARRAGTRDSMESEADKFAARLLMPEFAVASSVSGGLRNLNELAAAFKVSTLAMRYRLSDLGYSLG